MIAKGCQFFGKAVQRKHTSTHKPNASTNAASEANHLPHFQNAARPQRDRTTHKAKPLPDNTFTGPTRPRQCQARTKGKHADWVAVRPFHPRPPFTTGTLRNKISCIKKQLMKTVNHRFCERDRESERRTKVKHEESETTTSRRTGSRALESGGSKTGWLNGGLVSWFFSMSQGRKQETRNSGQQESSTRQHPRPTLPCGHARDMTVRSSHLHSCTKLKL